MNQSASFWKSKFAVNFVLVSFGIVIAALFLELTVRIFVPVSDFFWESNPVLGTKLVPYKRGRWVRRGLFDVQIQINSHGFRDREHSYEKAAGNKRVAMLGDSYLEALQVPWERSITYQLEEKLRSKGIRAETINLGVSGFGTGREYLMLRDCGLSYKPDLVLLFFVGNDLLNNSVRLEGKPYLPYPLVNGDKLLSRDSSGEPRFTSIVDTRSSLSFITGFLKDRSASFRLLRTTIDSSPGINEILYRLGLVSTISDKGSNAGNDFGLYEVYRSAEKEALSESWVITEQLVLEIRRLAATHSVKFAVVLVPAPWEVYPALWQAVLNRLPAMRLVSMDLEKPSLRLRSFLKAHGIMYMDLLPGFRDQANSSPLLFFEPDNHWTPAGHRLAADLIIDPTVSILRDKK
jgi:SGNH hydrolase-like domain, acetyltransferase AlgX